jgi:HPr kinase/phosphorylase
MKLSNINSQDLFQDNIDALDFQLLAGELSPLSMFNKAVLESAQSVADLVGHLNFIHPKRIQILGLAEVTYYQQSHEDEKRWHELIQTKPPCLIIADDLTCPNTLKKLCQEHHITLLHSPKPCASVIDHLRQYLSKLAAPMVLMHGVFMDILGMGVLITGQSGLGKSELALELITRGHGLIADDAIEFFCQGPAFIEGRCPPLLQNLLEVRGLGLLDICRIFGETAIRRKMKLKLIVELVKRHEIEIDRLPFNQPTQTILGQDIDKVILEIGAGRNMAVIIEAAVRHTILKLRGVDVLQNFIDQQRIAIEKNSL